MKVSFVDRIVSSLAYFTFGTFSIVWIIYVNVAKKRMSPYLSFNLYQAIFVSLILAVLAYIFEILCECTVAVPYVGALLEKINLFVNHTPIFYTFTLTGFLVTLLVFYLIFLCLIGKRPFIPFISDVIKENFGG